jgi:hypothetical protein
VSKYVDAPPISADFSPSTNKPSEDFTAKPGICAIVLIIDRSVVARGTLGGKTSGAPNFFNEFKVHVLKEPLRLCNALLPTSVEQVIPLAITGTEILARV